MNYYSPLAFSSFEVFYTLGSVAFFFFMVYLIFTKFVKNVGKSYYKRSKGTDSETFEDIDFND